MKVKLETFVDEDKKRKILGFKLIAENDEEIGFLEDIFDDHYDADSCRLGADPPYVQFRA
jgi:hypothetical protein